VDSPTDDRTGRDFRRYQLAQRLMAHQARTRTISTMTNLTRHQLATLRSRWRVTEDMRHRGPSPTSLAVFFRSPRARSEGASLAVLCRILNAVPLKRTVNAAKSFLSLDLGERLCEAYEAYRMCFPRSDLEFEQVVLLVVGLVAGDAMELGGCGQCGATILIDRLAARRRICSYCQTVEGAVDRESPSGSAGPAAVYPKVIQATLFD
jgi:hypothetical protein